MNESHNTRCRTRSAHANTPIDDTVLIWVTIDDGGPALGQHCTNVSRRPQPRAYSTSEDIHEDTRLPVLSVNCNAGSHRRRWPCMFAIEYFNENIHIHNTCF